MSKYRARKVTIDGITFDSQREGKRWADLSLMQRAGQISGLQAHPKYPLHARDGAPLCAPTAKNGARGRQYVVELDFTYFEAGQRVVEDVKGFDTPMSRLKRALVEAEYKVAVRIVR